MMSDLVLFLHGLWVLFILIGFPLAVLFRSRLLRLIHAAGLGFYLLLALTGWPCPLTFAEEAARQAAGQRGFSYEGSFLSAWVEKLLYGQSIPLWFFYLLAAAYLILVISSWWWWPRKKENGANRRS